MSIFAKTATKSVAWELAPFGIFEPVMSNPVKLVCEPDSPDG